MQSARFPSLISALMVFAVSPSAYAKDAYGGDAESVSCYQNGQLIFKAQERIRSFAPTTSMTLLADVSAGQVQEYATRLYASDRADVVCVVSNKK